jgi:hypothetical protein
MGPEFTVRKDGGGCSSMEAAPAMQAQLSSTARVARIVAREDFRCHF